MLLEKPRHTRGPVDLEFLARIQLGFGGPPVPKAFNEIEAVCSLALNFLQSVMNRGPATSDYPRVDLFTKSDYETGQIQQRGNYLENINFLGKKVLNMGLNVYSFLGILPAVEQ